MKNHDSRIAVTEDSLHRGVRPKPWGAVRVMELKPTSPWRHPRSMPDSRDPTTPSHPLPQRPGARLDTRIHPHDSAKTLKKGATDTQSPHRQDEVYYVATGRAVLAVDGRDYPVEPGTVVFVKANAKHRFHSITEDLTTLVFFAPAKAE